APKRSVTDCTEAAAVPALGSLAKAAPEVLVGERDALAQGNGRLPAERGHARAVHELARRAVGLGSVVDEFAAKADHVGDERGELGDRQVAARPDIDERRALRGNEAS